MLEVVIMLIKFTVSNYKNFNKPICLDLTSTHDYRFGKECIKDSVISKAIVYERILLVRAIWVTLCLI